MVFWLADLLLFTQSLAYLGCIMQLTRATKQMMPHHLSSPLLYTLKPGCASVYCETFNLSAAMQEGHQLRHGATNHSTALRDLPRPRMLCLLAGWAVFSLSGR
jgi:hypothetical protein